MRSAVLVVGFNRPHHLLDVLERIREAAPARLYIAIDGARSDLDLNAVNACHEVARGVDWAPTLLRLRDENLGCQRGVIDAVTWMLGNEPDGVVVEDDTLPSFSFFPFCDELLERFRDDLRVLAVSGESRLPPEYAPRSDSYRFTYMGPAGAWATWRDRWDAFLARRIDRSLFATFRALHSTRHSAVERRAHWAALMLANRTRAMDSWAYPFMLEGIVSERLTATPNVNLVADHGMGVAATHMSSVDERQQPSGEVSFPLMHPTSVAVDEVAESWSEEHEIGFGASSLFRNAVALARRLT